MKREEATQKILEAKLERGLTFEAIAHEVGRSKVWTTAALFGQASMSAEEAGLRLENSRQEFLVFRDAASEKISVLYKRRDGDFGLIVPEC